MKIRNTFGVSANCWQLLLKTLFLQVVIIAIAVAVSVLLFGEIVPQIIDAFKELDLGTFFTETATSIIDGTFNSQEFATLLEQKIADIKLAIESIPNFVNRISFSYILMLVIMCLYRMFIAAPDLTTVLSINEFMTTNARRPFTWWFFKRFGQSFKFTLLQFLVTFPLDLIVILSSVGFYVLFLVTFGWWTIIPAGIIAIMLYSMRFTIFAFWLPAIADGVPVTKALAVNFSKLAGNFWRIFLKTFITMAVMFAIIIVANYFLLSQITAIISALIALVAFYFIKCINMVEYYEANNKPYFAKKINIYGTDLDKKIGKAKQKH